MNQTGSYNWVVYGILHVTEHGSSPERQMKSKRCRSKAPILFCLFSIIDFFNCYFCNCHVRNVHSINDVAKSHHFSKRSCRMEHHRASKFSAFALLLGLLTLKTPRKRREQKRTPLCLSLQMKQRKESQVSFFSEIFLFRSYVFHDSFRALLDYSPLFL
ncbi:hypothetical protein QQP08_011281 [Theobroma cacao]|nr:hypothetical protein QQP08_011281 [Theobroma cacao]